MAEAKKTKEYIALEAFYDRNGRLFHEGDVFPAEEYSADELLIYATKNNRINRAVVKQK